MQQLKLAYPDRESFLECEHCLIVEFNHFSFANGCIMPINKMALLLHKCGECFSAGLTVENAYVNEKLAKVLEDGVENSEVILEHPREAPHKEQSDHWESYYNGVAQIIRSTLEPLTKSPHTYLYLLMR